MNKIAFLCVTPRESFLPPMFQSCVKEYYLWVKEQVALLQWNLDCQEQMELYGESQSLENCELFPESRKGIQLLYIQSSRKPVIAEVFRRADIVVMGLPGCKKEFDRMFMTIFPWKDRIKFFWNSRICRDEEFIRELCGEYKLHAAQIFEIQRGMDGKLKKLPSV